MVQDAAGASFALREISGELGIVFMHQPTTLDPKIANIGPHVSGMGASIAVTDVNGDGWPDLYTTNCAFGAPNALFVSEQGRHFVDRAAEAGLADLNLAGRGASMGSVWGDIDNDGDEDVYVYKWGYPQLLRNDSKAGQLAFTDVTKEAGLERWINSNNAIWFDYDRDGLLDLYVAGYFDEKFDLWNLSDTRIMQESFEFAKNGGRNWLLHNVSTPGALRFEDRTMAMGANSNRWTLACAAADLDGDGWTDLYLANDYGNEELFFNREGQRFEAATNVGLAESSKSGMSVSLGDVENDGKLDVFVTNISKRGFLFQGNNLRRNRLEQNGQFQNVSEGVVADCGWAWGAQFGDLDNDSWLDLFVANGFVSASHERDYWYGMSKVATGAGDVFLDAQNWPAMGDKSLSGYERSRVLWNKQGHGFFDVAQAVGADDLYDGRGVAMADLSQRGALDVVVANQKGPLLVYRSEPRETHNWVAFELVGTRSNRSAIGAQLTLAFAGHQQTQVVDGGMGFCAQNSRRLHFGLGEAKSVDSVRVRWPSGSVQELRLDQGLNRTYRIQEATP